MNNFNYNEFRNPLMPIETNLEVTIGAVMFRDEVIANLRNQIVNLRAGLSAAGISFELVEKLQHCKD